MSDLISRQTVIDALKNCECWVDSGYRTVLEYDTAYDAIRDVPTAEPRKGMWVPKDDRWRCTLCDGIAPKGIRWNYCPNCGARMEE